MRTKNPQVTEDMPLLSKNVLSPTEQMIAKIFSTRNINVTVVLLAVTVTAVVLISNPELIKEVTK